MKKKKGHHTHTPLSSPNAKTDTQVHRMMAQDSFIRISLQKKKNIFRISLDKFSKIQ